MSKEPSLEARVTELEGLLTYQERTIDELNRIVIGQGSQLERLVLRLEALSASLRAGGSPVSRSQDEDPPPHY